MVVVVANEWRPHHILPANVRTNRGTVSAGWVQREWANIPLSWSFAHLLRTIPNVTKHTSRPQTSCNEPPRSGNAAGTPTMRTLRIISKISNQYLSIARDAHRGGQAVP